MDEIRGSSDLANYADIILKTERKEGNLVLKQLKCRNAKEQEPIRIITEIDEEEKLLKYPIDTKVNCVNVGIDENGGIKLFLVQPE